MLAGDLAMALDPAIFARKALGFNPDPWQERVLRWSGKRLLLNCSRQSGKSTVTAILALHRALFYPDSLILLVSPSLRQSSELFRKVLNFYRQLEQPIPPEAESSLRLELKNGSRIVSLPGKEGTIRGFSGAALIVEDEAARVPDELYFTVRPMLAVSGGRLILMSTPFGKRGHFFKEWTEGGDTWERIQVTAYECPRISREFLEEERQTLGEWWFRQEYLCEFVETDDQLFTYDQVAEALSDEVRPLF
ncbi:MAG: terminase large subunit domain-containing protein [Desulfofundulus sp.]